MRRNFTFFCALLNVNLNYLYVNDTFLCPAGWAEKIFRTSQLGNKGFSAQLGRKTGLKMGTKNEFFVSVAGKKLLYTKGKDQ
jgi:hypothetical protein